MADSFHKDTERIQKSEALFMWDGLFQTEFNH